MPEPIMRLPATLFLRQLYTAFGDPPERGMALAAPRRGGGLAAQ